MGGAGAREGPSQADGPYASAQSAHQTRGHRSPTLGPFGRAGRGAQLREEAPPKCLLGAGARHGCRALGNVSEPRGPVRQRSANGSVGVCFPHARAGG